ncbi:MAG: hypothetical protein A3K19_11000 [Lentisphaerae bacterium RIFOXYB12_FULL_65_16]|nr:MAG: hypothetical protein A3K18_15130 [Lentisphaerae bacterium RIFOXYA12_64_32]OGV94357.1 MAG: hypothetical protein A3K19_11000 [Lentisphaerae bacterium RIFOXYB12_FULL_65_16]
MLQYRNGILHVDGASVRDLTAARETPFFLFSAGRLDANYAALATGLAAAGVSWRVRYCAKSNFEPALLTRLATAGADVLVSHVAEAELARDCGFAAERIAFQKPVLIESELRAVLGLGISHIHILRPADVDTLATCAAAAGRRIHVSLRLCNDRGISPLARWSARLGMSAVEACAAAARVCKCQHLEFHGLHFYIGTQRGTPSAFVPLLDRALRVAAALRTAAGVSVVEIDVGGGIPSPTLRRGAWGGLWQRLRHDADPPDPVDPVEAVRLFTAELGRVYRERVQRAGLEPLPVLVVEPGRAVAGNAAILVTRVSSVRGRWVFLDASRNHLPESPFLFTRRVLPVVLNESAPRCFRHLSGATLNTTDVMDLARRLPPLQPGDLLALCDAGAYSLARACRYAGLTPAAYLLDERGVLQSIRRAECRADLTAVAAPREDAHG